MKRESPNFLSENFFLFFATRELKFCFIKLLNATMRQYLSFKHMASTWLITSCIARESPPTLRRSRSLSVTLKRVLAMSLGYPYLTLATDLPKLLACLGGVGNQKSLFQGSMVV